MRVVVGKGAQAIVFFLAGGVPERKFDVGVVYEDVVDVVFEDCRFARRVLSALSQWQEEGELTGLTILSESSLV
jgi:hypothetical protein